MGIGRDNRECGSLCSLAWHCNWQTIGREASTPKSLPSNKTIKSTPAHGLVALLINPNAP
jgi:hypothetical protein